jgi:hypothetical protein
VRRGGRLGRPRQHLSTSGAQFQAEPNQYKAHALRHWPGAWLQLDSDMLRHRGAKIKKKYRVVINPEEQRKQLVPLRWGAKRGGKTSHWTEELRGTQTGPCLLGCNSHRQYVPHRQWSSPNRYIVARLARHGWRHSRRKVACHAGEVEDDYDRGGDAWPGLRHVCVCVSVPFNRLAPRYCSVIALPLLLLTPASPIHSSSGSLLLL